MLCCLSLAEFGRLDLLTEDDTQFFERHGYLRIPSVFTPDEVVELAAELDWLIEAWAGRSPGWSGDWRSVYMDPETEKQSKLVAMHDLYFYSDAWTVSYTHLTLPTTPSV